MPTLPPTNPLPVYYFIQSRPVISHIMGVILTFTNNLSNPILQYIRRPPQSLLVGAIYRTSASITSDISSSSSDPTNQSSSLSELVDRFFVLRFLLLLSLFPLPHSPSEGHSPILLVPCSWPFKSPPCHLMNIRTDHTVSLLLAVSFIHTPSLCRLAVSVWLLPPLLLNCSMTSFSLIIANLWRRFHDSRANNTS